MRLLRHIWPEPDPDLLEEVRRSGLEFRERPDIRVRGARVSYLDSLRLAAEDEATLVWEAVDDAHCHAWPPLGRDVDPAWRAASMLTALRRAIHEAPLLPVAYKALWQRGVIAPRGGYVWPSRFVSPAVCRDRSHEAPQEHCECGFHAAYSVVELADCYWCSALAGVLVVTPVGRTIWHSNAWRAAGYQVHAAVVDLEWVPPDGWDEEIPVVRARRQLIPWRAYQLAREVRTMLDLAGERSAVAVGEQADFAGRWKAVIDEQPVAPVAYKALRTRGVVGPLGGYVWPSRFVGPAVCRAYCTRWHRAPEWDCDCGFDAALSVSELVYWSRWHGDVEGILVVTPVGRCVWHSNAWRAAGYQVHAAVVDLDWQVPAKWDPEVPVIRAPRPLVPLRAYEIARQVKAMLRRR